MLYRDISNGLEMISSLMESETARVINVKEYFILRQGTQFLFYRDKGMLSIREIELCATPTAMNEYMC